MESASLFSPKTLLRDFSAGLVVFLVALPLCLGIALASNAPLIAGLITGIVGGILVGYLSGSQSSVSGPAAGLTAIVAAQIGLLQSYEAFLLGVVLGGVLQIGLGLIGAGTLAAFFPTSVIKGLLAAIGVILVLKQIPHVLGHDSDPEGEMSFEQPDHHNTFSELGTLLDGEIHMGAMLIGLLSIALLVVSDKWRPLKKSVIPMPLIVVVLGVSLQLWFRQFGGRWYIDDSHLVQVPVATSIPEFFAFLRLPDFGQWGNPIVYRTGLTIALVASLETLLNLEAVDKIDPQRRYSPPNRELLAQGVGNITVGLLGGIPMTSVIVRSSVNLNAGARTKLSAIFHGIMILICVTLFPKYLNMIPLSCLAAILLVTGIKLANPGLFRDMWSQGRYQFIPFIVTLVAIVLTDLLIGILIGLGVSLTFILNSNLRRPIRRIVEKHLGEEVLHIELPNQVSFLNRAALERILGSAPRGSHILLDASHSDYIDPDILALLREFKEQTAPVHGVLVSLSGFREKYQLHDELQFVDYSTRELQGQISSAQILQILREGNERFRTGHRLSRDFNRQLNATAESQHPLAVVLSCIDSRSPAELIFDLGLGDIFSVRVAGNVISRKILGSIEFGCAVAGAKLVVVMGHTRCGAVTAAVDWVGAPDSSKDVAHCQHLDLIVQEIQHSIDLEACRQVDRWSPERRAEFIDAVARENVIRTVQQIAYQCRTISGLIEQGRLAVVGAMYDVSSGQIEFFTEEAIGLSEESTSSARAL